MSAGGRDRQRAPRGRTGPGVAAARALIRLAGVLVPGGRRAAWRAEWEGELWQLRDDGRRSLGFALGAFSDAAGEGWQILGRDVLRHDLRQAARGLVRAPAFTVVAVLTLALGVGANATVLSLTSGLLFRPPPGIGDPEALVQVGRNADPTAFDNWSVPAYEAMAAASGGALGGMTAWSAAGAVVGRGSDARSVAAHLVAAGYFRVLDVRVGPGRVPLPDDGPVVVISERLWRERFGADPGVPGRPLTVNGRPFTIVGVARDGFAGADVFRAPADLFVPLAHHAVLRGRDDGALQDWERSWVWVLGRRASGVTAAAVRDALAPVVARLGGAGWLVPGTAVQVVEGVGVRPAERAAVRPVAALLLGLAALVLAVACVNLAGLAAARGSARAGAVGVRLALGAPRGRLVRELLVESMLLGILAAAVALVLAAACAPFLDDLLPTAVAVPFTPDLRVAGLTLLLGATAGFAFALPPALGATRADPAGALREAGRSATGGPRRLRSALVAGQVAVAFAVVAAAALLVRSVMNAAAARPGFDASGVVALALDPSLVPEATAGQTLALWRAVRAGSAAVPGAGSVGLVSALPVVDGQRSRTPLPPGGLPTAGPPPPPVILVEADAGYFAALRIPLVAGRLFEAADEGPMQAVAVVTRALAERFFPGASPLGRPLPFAVGDGPPPTVVGVVEDHQQRSLTDPPAAAVYLPVGSGAPLDLVVRGSGPPHRLLREVAEAVAAVRADLPPRRAAVLSELLARSTGGTGVAARFAAVFGSLTLLLAAVGLYGVLAQAVAHRRRELAIRRAVGARAGDLAALVARHALSVVVPGLLAGGLLTLAASRAVAGFLYDVTPGDPTVLAFTGLTLVLAAALAAAGPTRAAARAEPAEALRRP